MATDTEAPVKERSVPKPVFTDAEAGAREFPSSNSRSYNYYTPAKRRATVYEDVTVDVQPDPDRHLLQGWIYGFADGTGGYPQEWTALKSSNWHLFLDPNEEWEQTIYRNNANVVRQIGQNLANAKAARAFDGWNRGWIKTVEWLQWYDFYAEPGGVLESDPHQRGSIESLSILSGAVEVDVGGLTERAGAGETLRYRCDRAHTIRAVGAEPVHATMVCIMKAAVME